MYNVAQMKEARERYKDAGKHHDQGNKEFDFLDPRDLDEGKYYIRLFPKCPKSNPRGYRITGKHFLQGKLSELNARGEVKKKVFTCSGTEGGFCYFCDIYKTLDTLKPQSFFDNPRVDDGVKKAAGGLSPAIEYLYVISIMATSYKKVGDSGEWTRYKPSKFGAENEHGKIFTVKQGAILDDLETLLKAKSYGDITEGDENGSYLLLIKQDGKYEIKISDKTEVPIQNEELLKKYPQSFLKIGEKAKTSPVQSAAFLQDKDACWWGRYVGKYVELEPEEGVGEEEPVLDPEDIELDLEDVPFD